MLLILAILGLLLGPLLYLVPHWRTWDRLLDSFALAAVGGLGLFHLIPEAIDHGGPLVVLFALFGLALPGLLHNLEGFGPWVLLGGLVVHAGVESAALGAGAGGVLAVAVVLHRLPVGLAVFALYHEHPRTHGLGWVAIATLIATTLLGYVAGPALQSLLHPTAVAALEALVAGMLVHIVWEHGTESEEAIHDHEHDVPHLHDHGEIPTGPTVALATLLGFAMVALVTQTDPAHAHEHGYDLLPIGLTGLGLVAALAVERLATPALTGALFALPLMGPGLAALFGVQAHLDDEPVDATDRLAGVFAGLTLGAILSGTLAPLADLSPGLQVAVAAFAGLLPLPRWTRAAWVATLLSTGLHPAALAMLLLAHPRRSALLLAPLGVLLASLLPSGPVALPPSLVWAGAVGLGTLGVAGLVEHGPRGLSARIFAPSHAHASHGPSPSHPRP